MSEMIERVARAIFFADHRGSAAEVLSAGWNQTTIVNYDPRPKYEGIARAALAAMREPTEDMLEAASQAMRGLTFSDYPATQDATIFRAMLDAALKASPSGSGD